MDNTASNVSFWEVSRRFDLVRRRVEKREDAKSRIGLLVIRQNRSTRS